MVYVKYITELGNPKMVQSDFCLQFDVQQGILQANNNLAYKCFMCHGSDTLHQYVVAPHWARYHMGNSAICNMEHNHFSNMPVTPPGIYCRDGNNLTGCIRSECYQLYEKLISIQENLAFVTLTQVGAFLQAKNIFVLYAQAGVGQKQAL